MCFESAISCQTLLCYTKVWKGITATYLVTIVFYIETITFATDLASYLHALRMAEKVTKS